MPVVDGSIFYLFKEVLILDKAIIADSWNELTEGERNLLDAKFNRFKSTVLKNPSNYYFVKNWEFYEMVCEDAENDFEALKKGEMKPRDIVIKYFSDETAVSLMEAQYYAILDNMDDEKAIKRKCRNFVMSWSNLDFRDADETTVEKARDFAYAELAEQAIKDFKNKASSDYDPRYV